MEKNFTLFSSIFRSISPSPKEKYCNNKKPVALSYAHFAISFPPRICLTMTAAGEAGAATATAIRKKERGTVKIKCSVKTNNNSTMGLNKLIEVYVVDIVFICWR